MTFSAASSGVPGKRVAQAKRADRLFSRCEQVPPGEPFFLQRLWPTHETIHDNRATHLAKPHRSLYKTNSAMFHS